MYQVTKAKNSYIVISADPFGKQWNDIKLVCHPGETNKTFAAYLLQLARRQINRRDVLCGKALVHSGGLVCCDVSSLVNRSIISPELLTDTVVDIELTIGLEDTNTVSLHSENLQEIEDSDGSIFSLDIGVSSTISEFDSRSEDTSKIFEVRKELKIILSRCDDQLGVLPNEICKELRIILSRCDNQLGYSRETHELEHSFKSGSSKDVESADDVSDCSPSLDMSGSSEEPKSEESSASRLKHNKIRKTGRVSSKQKPSDDDASSAGSSSEDDDLFSDSDDTESPEPTQRRKWRCSTCSKCFESKSLLNRHHRLKHKKKRKMCPLCPMTFKAKGWSSMRKHVCLFHDGQAEDDFNYQRALKNLKDEIAAYQELAKKHSKKTKDHQCPWCKLIFINSALLKHHLKVDHRDKIFKCDVCNMTFLTKRSLANHMTQHDKSKKLYKCKICKASYRRPAALQFHSETHSGKVHKCAVCSKEYNHPYSLKTHMVIHGEPEYKCQLCSDRFFYKAVLQRHLRSVHSECRGFKCNLCEASYKFKHHLNDHVMSAHNERSNFTCDQCGRRFKVKVVLDRHKSVHRNGRPYKCDVCKSTYKTRANLYCHKRAHH